MIVDDETPEPERQPIFHAPWPVTLMVGVILIAFLGQGFLSEAAVTSLAFAPPDLNSGRWWTLFTALFIHVGWAHVLLNGGGVLAFGTPVVRAFGGRALGIGCALLFYLGCGVFASLGHAAFHLEDPTPLAGASGAVSGLMAAAAQLIAGQGRPGPLLSRPVIGMTAAWIVVNLIVAFTGIAPGSGGAPVAWDAHLAGFAAGLALFRPLAWLSRQDDGQLH